MFKKSTITMLFLIIGSVAIAQNGPKLKFDEPDDVFWDNRFGNYGTDGSILDIEYVNEDTLFIAGNFNTINGYHAHGIAMWDGVKWSAVPAGYDNISRIVTNSNNHGRVTDIEYVNGKLYFLSVGRYANFNESTNGILKSYDFKSKTFKLHDEHYVTSLVDLVADDDGTLFLLSAVPTLNSPYSVEVYYYINNDQGYLYNAPVNRFEQVGDLPRMKAADRGVVLIDLNTESVSNSGTTLTNPMAVYVTNDLQDGITDFGIDSVYAEIHDVDRIDGGFLFTGSTNIDACFDCAISKFGLSDSKWSSGYFFDVGFNPPVRIVGKDEENFSFLRPGYQRNYYLDAVKDGIYNSNGANIELEERYNEFPVTSMVHVGESLLFSFEGSRINADQPITGIGLIDDGVKQFGKNTISLGLDGTVNTMIEVGNMIFVGGSFQSSGGTYLRGLGVFENDTWESIGHFGSVNEEAEIYSLMAFDKYVFVGGNFDYIATQSGKFYANNAAIYDTSDGSWSSMGNLEGFTVYDMEKVGNTIYAIVYDQEERERKLFTYIRGSWREYDYYRIDSVINEIQPQDIISLKNTLYIVGNMNVIKHGGGRNEHSMVSISEDGFIPFRFPNGDSLFAQYGRLSKIDERIILSVFDGYDTNEVNSAIETKGLYTVVGDTVEYFLPTPSRSSLHVIGSGDRLFAYNASRSGGAGLNGIATWDGDSWSILGSGVSYTGYSVNSRMVNTALITNDGKLAVGGQFNFAGNKPASNFTFWSGETAPSTPVTISFKSNQVIDYSESLTFKWTNANLSSSFEFELSEVSDFSSIMVGLAGIADNEVEVRADFQPGVIYYWRVRAVNSNGVSAWSEVGTFEMAAAVSNEAEDAVTKFELLQNYPNPFNPTTNIQFSIPESQSVKLSVFDVSGRKVATLYEGQRLSAGTHTIAFRADHLSSGVYFYRLEAGSKIQIKKMLLIK